MRAAVTALLLALLADAPAAQGDDGGLGSTGFQTPQSLRRDRDRLRRQLHSVQADRQRMLDLLVRHGLGVALEDEAYFDLERGMDTAGRDEAARRLRVLETENRNLEEEWMTLRDRLRSLRGPEEPAEPPPEGSEGERWTRLPDPNRTSTPAGDPTLEPSGEEPVPLSPMGGGDSGSRDLEGEGQEEPRRSGPEERTRVLLVPGSTDRAAVARLQYRAGRRLFRRGIALAGDGEEQAAGEVLDRARARFEQALKELEPLVAGEEAEYRDLFHQGRCLESLFLIDLRRGRIGLEVDAKEYQRRLEDLKEPFTTISARDSRRVGEVEKFGTWGRAANAALDQIRWRTRQTDYRPLDPADWKQQ